jgi:hypothetical protein
MVLTITDKASYHTSGSTPRFRKEYLGTRTSIHHPVAAIPASCPRDGVASLIDPRFARARIEGTIHRSSAEPQHDRIG